MAPLNVVLHEGVPVLAQVQALQPVGHVVLIPHHDGLGGKGLVGGGLDERERGRRAAAARAKAERRCGQAEHIRHGGGRGGGRQGGRGAPEPRVRRGHDGGVVVVVVVGESMEWVVVGRRQALSRTGGSGGRRHVRARLGGESDRGVQLCT